jgi:hypothetical protein
MMIIGGEYYRGLLIYCFAFEFGHCFQPRSPLLKSKAARQLFTQYINWLNIFSLNLKEQRKPSNVKNNVRYTMLTGKQSTQTDLQ